MMLASVQAVGTKTYHWYMRKIGVYAIGTFCHGNFFGNANFILGIAKLYIIHGVFKNCAIGKSIMLC